MHPERITQNNKRLLNDLDYDGTGFHVREKVFGMNETKNNICINAYCYENKLTFPIYISDQKFDDSMDLLLVIDEKKSHYLYVKDFDRFMFHKTKSKNKKHFCQSCLQCFSSKKILTEHKEVCLSINGVQSVRPEKGTTEFKNYLNKHHLTFILTLSVTLKVSKVTKALTQKKDQDHITCSFAYKLVCVDDKFSKPIVVFRGKDAAFKFIEAILKEYEYCIKVMKKHFHKNLIMTGEEQEQFQSSNMCWICENPLKMTMKK